MVTEARVRTIRKWISKLTLNAVGLLLLASPLMAQNIKLSGPHYNLNIIGVEKDKTTDMQDTSRHTIFVALGNSQGGVSTNIYLVPGSDFSVCDGNGFDAAVDCDGNQKSTNGAVFQLPCNTNIPDDQQLFVPCDIPEAEQAAYSVYARALGKPGGQSTITTCATDPYDNTVVCSTENAVVVRPTSTNGNKPAWQDVTKQLTSLVTCYDTATGNYGSDVCSLDTAKTVRVALFSGGLYDWFWNYYNQGLRLAQLRFYLQ
jgi:hypothetical protein